MPTSPVLGYCRSRIVQILPCMHGLFDKILIGARFVA
jgi:hypothetical protein